MILKRLVVIIFFIFLHVALLAQPRQKISFDLSWRFKLGDPADIDKKFNYPEIGDLKKTRIEQVGAEKKLISTRIDPVTTRLGEKISYVQPSFNTNHWRLVNLPHDWAVELPYNPKGNVSKA